MSRWCEKHQCEYDDDSYCRQCDREDTDRAREEWDERERRAEDRERAEQHRASELDLLDEIANRPRFGDDGHFRCPACNRMGLDLDAKKCVACHERIPAEYWILIHEQRRAADEAAAAERERRAEEYAERRREATARNAVNSPEDDALVFLVLFMLALVGAGVLQVVSWFSDRAPRPVVAVPEQYADSVGCLGEGCDYGSRYRAQRTVSVYASRPARVGEPVASLAVARRVRVGEWVTAVTGVVLATRGEAIITAAANRRNGTNLPVGLSVPTYGQYAELCGPVWVAEAMRTMCELDVTDTSRTEWWVRVQLTDGSLAWSNGLDGFESMGMLTTRLAELLGADTVSTDQKKLEISSAIAAGVDLGSPTAQYGRGILDGAISSNDTLVLLAVMASGARLRADACPLSWNLVHARAPGGEVMLEFLLAHGSALSCLHMPPFLAFLGWDFSSPSYPLERAARIAKVLREYGADAFERDADGRSILGVLDDPRWSERVGVLRAAVLGPPKDSTEVPPP